MFARFKDTFHLEQAMEGENCRSSPVTVHPGTVSHWLSCHANRLVLSVVVELLAFLTILNY